MIGRVAWVLILTASLARAEPPAERPLTSAEQRLLDGAYLYLVSPDFCDPALPRKRLGTWVAGLIRQHGLPPAAAATYLADQQPRLNLIAEAAFNGRHGKDLCRRIFVLRDAIPELRPPAAAD